MIKTLVSHRLPKTNERNLPDELMVDILARISDSGTLARCARVSRRWARFLGDNLLWKYICTARKFITVPITHDIAASLKVSDTEAEHQFGLSKRKVQWRSVFIQNHQTLLNWRQGIYTVTPSPFSAIHGRICMHLTATHAISMGAPQISPTAVYWDLRTGDSKIVLDDPMGRITAVRV